MINEATRENLRRKSAFVDQVQMYGDKPLFSWLDLSLTELCNRSAGHRNACKFCPRIDATFYPNQALHMSLELVQDMRKELRFLRYTGTVVLCGYGEPLLHPHILTVVRFLGGQGWRLEIVTNGDRLTRELAVELYIAGVDCLVVSMYDGPHQSLRFHEMLTAAGGVEGETFILRDRWHTAEDAFGLKLTNRAGTVSEGKQDPLLPGRACFYLAYQLTIDWNGDALLCVQDWHKKVKFGNASNSSLFGIWQSPALQKRRVRLLAGDRSASPCSTCNTDGQLHGHKHAEAWACK